VYTLCESLIKRYPQRYVSLALALNERAAVQAGLIESRLPGGLPYVSLNGLILTPPESAKIKYLTNQFGTIYTKTMHALVTSADDATLKALGWADHLVYALRHEPPNRFLTTIGRFDYVQDISGNWHVLEFNSDTPSGSQEVTLVEALTLPFLRRVANVQSINPTIGQAMMQALADEASFPPVPVGYKELFGPFPQPVIGFMVSGRYLTDLAQVLFYANGLKKMGYPVIVADPANISLVNGRIYFLGKEIDAFYRLYQIEALALEPLFAAYTQATLIGGIKSLNNLRGFFAQSKAVMAWIWRERYNSELFSPEEQAVIAEYLPETLLLSELPADFDRTGYIIKEFYGREGAEVFNGATMTDEEWENCREWGTYVAQKRVAIAPVPHASVSLTNELQQGQAYPCVGGFFIGGTWQGCYTRIGAIITNSQAQFIPTLVEG
jgi:glutathionylspermidine synthase